MGSWSPVPTDTWWAGTSRGIIEAVCGVLTEPIVIFGVDLHCLIA
jgi:hypothetical protein